LTFKFTGTAITVVGVVPNKRVSNKIGFKIDDGPETDYTRDVATNFDTLTAEDFDYGVTLFSTSGLSASEHTLSVFAYLQGPLFAIDYLDYTEAAAASPSSNSQTTGTSTSNTGTTTGTNTASTTSGTSTSAAASTTDSNGSLVPVGPSLTDSRSSPSGTGISVGSVDSSSQSQNKVPVPAAVGGAIGGIAGLALIIFGIYLCLRRQRTIEQSHQVLHDHLEAANTTEAAATSGAPIPLRNLSEKQRLVMELQRRPDNRQETTAPFMIPLTKPPLAAMAPSTSSLSHENQSRSLHQTPPSANVLPPHSPPPSFRTRPLSRPLEAWEAPVLPQSQSSTSSGPHPPPPGAATEITESEYGLPPYAEDVLARPDARNLSEADVDVIARRLAEVMRAQRQARTGPGLLREHEPPPRELIDQLVEEHLGAREGTN
jgi:hypothetical protein